MKAIDYDEVKSRLDIISVARWLGIDVDRDTAPCPFHKETSEGGFRFNEKHQYCHCFSCGESADSVSLVSKLLGISAPEAVKRLNDVFSLGYSFGKTHVTPEERLITEQWQKRKAEQAIAKRQIELANELMDYLAEMQESMEPVTRDEPFPDKLAFIIDAKDAIVFMKEFGEYDTDKLLSIKSDIIKYSPAFERRKDVHARIQKNFKACIGGEINLDTLIKKHKKAVKELEQHRA